MNGQGAAVDWRDTIGIKLSESLRADSFQCIILSLPPLEPAIQTKWRISHYFSAAIFTFSKTLRQHEKFQGHWKESTCTQGHAIGRKIAIQCSTLPRHQEGFSVHKTQTSTFTQTFRPPPSGKSCELIKSRNQCIE